MIMISVKSQRVGIKSLKLVRVAYSFFYILALVLLKKSFFWKLILKRIAYTLILIVIAI